MATDYMRGYNPNQSTGTGWSDYTFTEEDIKRFEEMGYDPRSALEAGYSAEEIIATMQDIEAERGGGLSPEGEYVNPQAIEEEKAIQAYKDEREAVMPTPQSAPVQAPLDSMREPPPEFEGLTDSRRWGFDENVEWSDYAKTGGSAFTSLLGEGIGFLLEGAGKRFDLPELVDGGKYIRERSKQVTDTIQETISPAAKQHMYGPRSLFKFKNEGDIIPEAWGNFDLETLLLLGSSGVGSSAAILAPGAGIGRAATALTGGRLPGAVAGAVGMGTAGGALEGANTAAQVYDGLKAVDRETLVKSPMYKTAKEEIIKQFPNATDERIEEFVREQIATQAAWETGAWTGAFIGLTSAWPGSLLGRTGFFGGNVKDKYRQGLAKSFYKGGKAEAIQEFFQEGGQQLAINYGDYLAGKELQPFNTKGVTEAGATGAVAGGPIGGLAQAGFDTRLEREPRPDMPKVGPAEEIPTGKAGELEEERKEAEKQLTEEAKAKPKVVNKKLRVLNDIKERIDNGEFKDEVGSFPPDIIKAARGAGVKGLETKTNPTATLADVMATNNITESDLLKGVVEGAEEKETTETTTSILDDLTKASKDNLNISDDDIKNQGIGDELISAEEARERIVKNYERQIDILKKYKDPNKSIGEKEWKKFAKDSRRSPSLETYIERVATTDEFNDWVDPGKTGEDFDVDVVKKAIDSMSDEEIKSFAGGNYNQAQTVTFPDKEEETKVDKEEETKVDKEEETKVDKEEETKVDKEEETKVDKEEETKVDKKEETKVDKKEETKAETTENVEAERKTLKTSLNSAKAVIKKQEKNRERKEEQLKKKRVQRSKLKNKAERDRLDAIISKDQESLKKTKETIQRKTQEKAEIESRLAELPEEETETKKKETPPRERKKKDETKVEKKEEPEPEPEPKPYDLVERKLYFGVGKYLPKKKVPKAEKKAREVPPSKRAGQVPSEDYKLAVRLYEGYHTKPTSLVTSSNYSKPRLFELAKSLGLSLKEDPKRGIVDKKIDAINKIFEWVDDNYSVPIEVIPSEQEIVQKIVSERGHLRSSLDKLLPKGMVFRLLDTEQAYELEKKYESRIKQLQKKKTLSESEKEELDRLTKAMNEVGGVAGKVIDENGNERQMFFTSDEFKAIVKRYREWGKSLLEKNFNSNFSNQQALYKLLASKDETVANQARIMLMMEEMSFRQGQLISPNPRMTFMGNDGHLLETPFGISQDEVNIIYSRVLDSIEQIEGRLNDYTSYFKDTGVIQQLTGDEIAEIASLEARLLRYRADLKILLDGQDRPNTLNKNAKYRRQVNDYRLKENTPSFIRRTEGQKNYLAPPLPNEIDFDGGVAFEVGKPHTPTIEVSGNVIPGRMVSDVHVKYKRHKNGNLKLDSAGKPIPIGEVHMLIPTGQAFEEYEVGGYGKLKYIKVTKVPDNITLMKSVQEAVRKYENAKQKKNQTLREMGQRQFEARKKLKESDEYKKLDNAKRQQVMNSLIGEQQRKLKEKKGELLRKHSFDLAEYEKKMRELKVPHLSAIIRPDNYLDVEMDKGLTKQAQEMLSNLSEELETLENSGWYGLYIKHGIYKNKKTRDLMDAFTERMASSERTRYAADGEISDTQLEWINSQIGLMESGALDKASVSEELGRGSEFYNSPESILWNDSNSDSISLYQRKWFRARDGSKIKGKDGKPIPVMEPVLEKQNIMEEKWVWRPKTEKRAVYARDEKGKVIMRNYDGTLNPAGNFPTIESEEEVLVVNENGDTVMERVKVFEDTGKQDPNAKPQFQREVQIQYKDSRTGKMRDTWIDEDFSYKEFYTDDQGNEFFKIKQLKKGQSYAFKAEMEPDSPLRKSMEKEGEDLSDEQSHLKWNKVYRLKESTEFNAEQEEKWPGTGYLIPKMRQAMEVVEERIPHENPRFTYWVRASEKHIDYERVSDFEIKIKGTTYVHKNDNKKKTLEPVYEEKTNKKGEKIKGKKISEAETIEVLGPIQKEVKRIISSGMPVPEWIQVEIDKDSGFSDLEIQKDPVFFMKDGKVMQRFIGMGRKKYDVSHIVDMLMKSEYERVGGNLASEQLNTFRISLEQIQERVNQLKARPYVAPPTDAIRDFKVNVFSDYEKADAMDRAMEADLERRKEEAVFAKIWGKTQKGIRIADGKSRERFNNIPHTTVGRKGPKENRLGWKDKHGRMETDLVLLPQGLSFFDETVMKVSPAESLRIAEEKYKDTNNKIHEVSRMYVKDPVSGEVMPNPKMYIKNPETGEYKEITESWYNVINYRINRTKESIKDISDPLQHVKVNVAYDDVEGLVTLDIVGDNGTIDGSFIGTVTITQDGSIVNRSFNDKATNYWNLTSSDINLLIGRSTGIYHETSVSKGKNLKSIMGKHENIQKSMNPEEILKYDEAISIRYQEEAEALEANVLHENGYVRKDVEVNALGNLLIKVGLKKPMRKWVKLSKEEQAQHKKMLRTIKASRTLFNNVMEVDNEGVDVKVPSKAEKKARKEKRTDTMINNSDPLLEGDGNLYGDDDYATPLEYVSMVADRQKKLTFKKQSNLNTKQQQMIQDWWEKKYNKEMNQSKFNSILKQLEDGLGEKAFAQEMRKKIGSKKPTLKQVKKAFDEVIQAGVQLSQETKDELGFHASFDEESNAMLQVWINNTDDFNLGTLIFGEEDASKIVQLYTGETKAKDKVSTVRGQCKL